jgi:hypothetical protein
VNLPTRFGALFVVAAAAGASAAAACGGNDGTAVTSDDGGAGSEGGGVLVPGDSGTHDPLNGVDAGCPVKAIGPRSGGTAASLARPNVTGGLAWGSPSAARSPDGQSATVTLAPDQGSELLRITDFGFTVPSTAKVLGVEVELMRQASDTGIIDGNIELWLDGAASDRPKYLATAWPRTTVGTHHYGQAVDPWGNDLTPELVGRSGFGVEIWARRQEDAGTMPLEARVESMRMTVFYCD